MEIKDKLIQGAIDVNTCANGVLQIGECKGKEALVEYFWRSVDYCLAKNFPSKDLIVKEFSKEAKAHDIYIDEDIEIRGEYTRRSVLLGKCTGVLIANDFTVCRIYVKHDSTLRVKASGNAIVLIDALDNSRVEVECMDDAKVNVYLYSKATSTGATKTVHKNMETYEL